MLIIPAIDLQDGCVVRFVQGIRDKKIYSREPSKTAKHWAKTGAKMIHVVDLDGAFTGEPRNLDSLRQIIHDVSVPIEFGGGVRSFQTIKALLRDGVQRVVLGTRAAEDKKFLKDVFSEFGERVIVSIDAKAGAVLTKGWKSGQKGVSVKDLTAVLKETGFQQVIYTDTTKDGTLSGPNVQGVKKLLKESGLNIIASGGVSKLSDISKLKKLEKYGLTGVIIGKALYEGKFTLPEAIKLS